MTDNSLKLGKGKNAYSLNMENIKAGVKKEAVKEFANLFDMYDADGNQILTNEEIGKVKSDVQTAAKGGRDSIFSEKDAQKMLQAQTQAEATKADAQKLFDFLQKLEAKAAQILNYEETDEAIITKSKDQNGNEVTETFDRATGKTERVVSQNGQTIVTILKGEVKEKETITDEKTGEVTTIDYDATGEYPVKKVIVKNGENPSTTTIDYKNGVPTQSVIEEADSKTTIEYTDGKESKKTIEKKDSTEVYTFVNGKEQIQTKIENKNSVDQKTTEYTYQEDGRTETITDRTGTEVIQYKNNGTTITTKNGKTTTLEKAGEGFKETIETEGSENKTVNELNADHNRTKQTKIVNGKEYTLNYDGQGNITGVIVQFGENPAKIAQKFGCSLQELLEVNKDIVKTDRKGHKYFEIGAEIKVPDKENKIEADAKVFKGRKDAAGAKADYRNWQIQQEKIRLEKQRKAEEARRQRAAEDAELAERKQNRFTFIEKKYNTFEAMARGHFLQEGVKNPTARQIALRVAEYKSYNPTLKDGELIGKRVIASYNKNTAAGISERQAAREAAREDKKAQTQSAQNIYNQLLDSKGFWNDDEDAMRRALKQVDNPQELSKLNELLQKAGYKADSTHSALEKFMDDELDSKEMDSYVQKWLKNGALKGQDAIKAKARLAARQIIDACDGFGTDEAKVKSALRQIKGNNDKETQAIYAEVDRIMKQQTWFLGLAHYQGLDDYLSGDLSSSDMKYSKGILAENNAITGDAKVKAITDLAIDATDGWGTDIEGLEQALRACSTPEERKAVEAKLEAYCKKHNIKSQIPGQSAIQRLLYSECDGFAGIGTDHKEIRGFNEMMIARGAYSKAEAVQIRAEQAALQILEGGHGDIMDAVANIKDKAVLTALDQKLAAKGKGSLKQYLANQFKGNQVKQDLVMANLASKNLLSDADAAAVAARLVQNSDFDTRAAGLQAIRTGAVADAVNKQLQAKGTSLEKIYAQFNKEKAEYKAKGDFWDGLAQIGGGLNPLGYVAEHISDQYYENTDMADNLYLEAQKGVAIDPNKKAGYQAAIQSIEEALNAAKEKYESTIKSQGWVSGAINAFCSVYNLGTTRDEIEATLKYNEETVRLLKIAAEGKLTKMVNGKTVNVSFEEIFQERQSKRITANGGGIVNDAKKALGIDQPQEVKYDQAKVDKVAQKAKTIAAMDIAKDAVVASWTELSRAEKSGNQKQLSTAIYTTIQQIHKLGGKITLEEFGLKMSNGSIVDKKGLPVKAEDLKSIASDLKSRLSQMTSSLFGKGISAGSSPEQVDELMNKLYDEKMEKFKEEYKEAFGQDAPDSVVEKYVDTIETGMTVVNVGAAIGAIALAPFTGGGSLGMFVATAGLELTVSALEHSTDANGWTSDEMENDITQAVADGALAATAYKVGQYTEVVSRGGGVVEKATSKGFVGNFLRGTAQTITEATPESLKAVCTAVERKLISTTTTLAKLNPTQSNLVNSLTRKAIATGIDVASDVFTSAVAEYIQNGEISEEGFWRNMAISAAGNLGGHLFEGSYHGDIDADIDIPGGNKVGGATVGVSTGAAIDAVADENSVLNRISKNKTPRSVGKLSDVNFNQLKSEIADQLSHVRCLDDFEDLAKKIDLLQNREQRRTLEGMLRQRRMELPNLPSTRAAADAAASAGSSARVGSSAATPEVKLSSEIRGTFSAESQAKFQNIPDGQSVIAHKNGQHYLIQNQNGEIRIATALTDNELVRVAGNGGNPLQEAYIKNSIEAKGHFTSAIESGEYVQSVESYRATIEDAHRIAYAGESGSNLYYTKEVEINGRTEKVLLTPDQMKAGEVRTGAQLSNNYVEEAGKVEDIARRYGDNYSTTGTSQVRLAGISDDALPSNIGSQHIYPSGASLDQYFTQMHRTAQEAVELIRSGASEEQILKKIAEHYQYAANCRPFTQINNSLFMNEINTLLEQAGMRPMPHGMLDHAAMRLQPESFQQYFIDQYRATSVDAPHIGTASEHNTQIFGGHTEYPEYLDEAAGVVGVAFGLGAGRKYFQKVGDFVSTNREAISNGIDKSKEVVYDYLEEDGLNQNQKKKSQNA